MEATVEIAELNVEFEDVIVTDLPGEEEYVPCEQCDSIVKNGVIVSNRSYMFFFYKNGLFSFCKHHGEKNQGAIEASGGTLVMDTRYRLIESRTKE